MSLNEKELELFKRWLKGLLADGVVTVTFTKKDGTERVMSCTTADSFVPESMLPSDSKKQKKINESVMNVYDVELSAWKSFRWESVKQVRITLE